MTVVATPEETQASSMFPAWFPSKGTTLTTAPDELVDLAHCIRSPLHIVTDATRSFVAATTGGVAVPSFNQDDMHLLGTLPAIYPELLGGNTFTDRFDVRLPIVFLEDNWQRRSNNEGLVLYEADEHMVKCVQAEAFESAWSADSNKSPTWGVTIRPTLAQEAIDALIACDISVVGFDGLATSAGATSVDAMSQVVALRGAVFVTVSSVNEASAFLDVASALTVRGDIVAMLPAVLALSARSQAPPCVGAEIVGSPHAAATAFALGASYVVRSRTTTQHAVELLQGTAVLMRAQQMRALGLDMPMGKIFLTEDMTDEDLADG